MASNKSVDRLEVKFDLMQFAPYDRRMKRKHLLIYGFILDWYHRDYGDALASVRHIVATLKGRDPFGNGLPIGDVHKSISDLVAWGYLTQQKGSGRRASRYVPVWDRSVRILPNTTDDEFSVQENDNTSVQENENATPCSVSISLNEDQSNSTRVKDPETRIDGINDCAPASPPPGFALEGQTGAGSAQGFEELWRAYGYRQKKADARMAYVKLAPNSALHGQMVTAARAWRAAWMAQGKPDAPRKSLHTWINEELYDCDPPKAYRGKTPKKAANDNNIVMRDITVRAVQAAGIGRWAVNIDFNDAKEGEPSSHTLMCSNELEVSSLMSAANIQHVEDAEGARVMLEIDEDSNFRFMERIAT